MRMICGFCSIIIQVGKIPPTNISKICCEYGQNSSSTPILRVYFDNIGSWNRGTCSLCTRGNVENFRKLFSLVNLFTRQVWEQNWPALFCILTKNLCRASGIMGGKKMVCVIGSGVVGLTTAVKLLEDCHPDVEVLDFTSHHSCEIAQHSFPW